jgi:poly(ADP-ribose) glycohydrolase ARH3
MGNMVNRDQLRKKFLGCLMGVAIGDGMGASREGRFMATEEEILITSNISQPMRYTDDTHTTIGVAESLIENSGFNGAHMAKRFADNYYKEPWRGYGPGPPRVFQLLRDGEEWNKASTRVYHGGSFGNGAAMRVAPVGLLFWNHPEELREVARQSGLITHSHALGMEGAALQARAVAMAVAENPDNQLDSESFVSRLLDFAAEDVYRAKITRLNSLLGRPDDRQAVVRELGHGIEAFNSVPTAIFSFLAHPQDFTSAIVYAISLGGDTDTIASMAGAISGAYLGLDAIPSKWQERLENRDYILNLAGKLWHLGSGGMAGQ